MDIIFKDGLFGLILAYVPIISMSYYFDKETVKNEFSYTNMIRSVPIIFLILNILSMAIFRTLNINNMFIIGIIMSIIYSSIGRFMFNIPTRVFDMNNPNMFHIYALITWSLVYGIIGNIYYNL